MFDESFASSRSSPHTRSLNLLRLEGTLCDSRRSTGDDTVCPVPLAKVFSVKAGALDGRLESRGEGILRRRRGLCMAAGLCRWLPRFALPMPGEEER